MRLRVILIIVAIVIAGVAVFGVIAYMSNIRQTAEKEVEKIEVLIAAQNIQKDTFVDDLIASKSVVLEAIPRKYISEGVLTTLDNFKGFVTVSPISKGEQITTTKFVKPEQVGLAFNIPGDMVAISIPVDAVVGVSNLIRIGDMVNVIATFMPDEKKDDGSSTNISEATANNTELVVAEEAMPWELKEPITKTLLWNVKVLYLGTREMTLEEQKEKDSKVLSNQAAKEGEVIKVNTVTLAVSPEDSEKLVFSEEMGLVWLALVPADGIEEKETPGRTYKNIFEE
jgi:pilus assembly protein CpaB